MDLRAILGGGMMEQLRTEAKKCDSHGLGHEGNCRCFRHLVRIANDLDSDLAKLVPALEAVIAAGQAMHDSHCIGDGIAKWDKAVSVLSELGGSK
jgi:hypothetical protein